MCYSAMVWADYRKYIKAYGADIDIHEFARLAERVLREGRVQMPKGMVDAFAQASTPAELEVKALLDQWAAQEASKLQEGLFAQRKRLADAERVLAARTAGEAAKVIAWWHHDWSMVGDTATAAAQRIRAAARAVAH